MLSMVEQTQHLAEAFPPECKVQVILEKLPGRVRGYRVSARKNKMGLIVDVPGDTWILYSDQVVLTEV